MSRALKSISAGVLALSVIAGAGLAVSTPAAQAESASSAASRASAFQVDAVHSAVIFRVKHNEAAYNYGRFNTLSGTAAYDTGAGLTSMEITVDTNSVDTANKSRDDHLRSPDFFNTKQFPRATFKSTSIAKKGDHSYEVAGDFTLNGVTKAITVTVDHTGNGKTRSGEDIVGFETTFDIKRTDFGMNKYLPGVGDEVRLMIGLEMVAK